MRTLYYLNGVYLLFFLVLNIRTWSMLQLRITTSRMGWVAQTEMDYTYELIG